MDKTLVGEENWFKFVWDASTRTKIWSQIRVQKTPTHNIKWLWWDFLTYLRWNNQNKHTYAWFDTRKHKISRNNTVFGYEWQLHKPAIPVSSICKYFIKVYPRSLRCMYKFEKVNSSFFPSRIHKYKYSKSCFHSFMF